MQNRNNTSPKTDIDKYHTLLIISFPAYYKDKYIHLQLTISTRRVVLFFILKLILTELRIY